MSGNGRENQVFTSTPWAVCQDGFGRQSASVRTGRNPRTKIAVPNLRMRPNFRSWLRYNRETGETDFSPRKPVPSYELAPVRLPFCPRFRHSPDTKWARMRPHFPICFRYERETMRPISATKNFVTATILVSPATKTPLVPCFPSYGNLPQCDRLFVAGSDTTMRPVRPRPSHPSHSISVFMRGRRQGHARFLLSHQAPCARIISPICSRPKPFSGVNRGRENDRCFN